MTQVLLDRLLMPLATASAIALVSPAHSAIAPDLQPATALPPAELIAQEPILQTVLYFETDTMAVRIQGRGNDLFMNLYNKRTNIVEVRNTPAETVASTFDRIVYRNSLGEAERFATITVLGETELKIVAPSGEILLQEPGYNTVVGVASGETEFQGNNFAPGTSAVVISARYASLRQQPTTDSSRLATVPRRELVDVLDRVGNPRDRFIWYQVNYGGQTGWIRGDLLQPG